MCSDFTEIYLNGSVNLMFYDHDDLSADDKMFTLWLNTRFEKAGEITIGRLDLDKACKDKKKRFKKDFTVTLTLEAVDDMEFSLKALSLSGADASHMHLAAESSSDDEGEGHD